MILVFPEGVSESMGDEVSTAPTVRILQGHVLDMLKTLPDASVHCVVTSPPYRIGVCGTTRGAGARRKAHGKGAVITMDYSCRTTRIKAARSERQNPLPTAPSAKAPGRTIRRSEE